MNTLSRAGAIALILSIQATPVPAEDRALPTDPPRQSPAAAQKQGDVTGSCIPMKSEQKRGAVAGICIAEKPGQKRGNIAGTCITYGEGSNVVKTFPNGAKLLATVQNGELVGYTAVDRRGQALKVSISREPVVPTTPGDAIERGQRRAEERRQAWERALNGAMGQSTGKGCFLFIFTVDGMPAGVTYGECPKGATAAGE